MAKKEKTRTYKIKALIGGYKLGHPGETLVAVPNKYEGSKTTVRYGSEKMTIECVGKNVVTFRTFEDKFGRNKNYTLLYYKWVPGHVDSYDPNVPKEGTPEYRAYIKKLEDSLYED
jgi:hypothetical protein